MGLIDSEAEKLAKMRAESGESEQVPKPAPGLGRRFGALNKAAKRMEEFRNKSVTPPAVEQSRRTNSETNAEQLRNNSETNAEQLRNNSVTESETIPEQTKVETDPMVVYGSSGQSLDFTAKASDRPVVETSASPALGMGNLDLDDSKNSETNPKQISNNSVTIAKQSEPISNGIPKQLRNNSVINSKQFRNKIDDKRNNSETIAEQIRNEKRNTNRTIPKQISNNSVTPTDEIPVSLARLSGHKLAIVKAIFDLCNMNGSRISGAVSRETLVSMTGAGPEVIRVTADRLENEGYLKVLESKRGRGGWTVYELNSNLYNQLVTHDFRNNSVTTPKSFRTNSVTESETQNETTASSKLDSNLNNTNSLTEDGLDEVDFSACASFNITKSIIQDIRKNRWSISRYQLEDHIERFAFWAGDASNRKGINNLRGLFCSHLKRIAETGEDPLDWVRTPSSIAMENILAEKKRQLEQLQQQRAEELRVDFELWLISIPEHDLRQMVPGTELAPFGSEIHKTLIRDYYEKVVRKIKD